MHQSFNTLTNVNYLLLFYYDALNNLINSGFLTNYINYINSKLICMGELCGDDVIHWNSPLAPESIEPAVSTDPLFRLRSPCRKHMTCLGDMMTMREASVINRIK